MTCCIPTENSTDSYPEHQKRHSYTVTRNHPCQTCKNGHGFSCVHYKSKKIGLTVMPKH